MKTLEEFDFAQSPHIPAARVRALAEGGYLERSEPVLLVGNPAPEKRIWPPAWPSPPAGSGSVFASLPRPRWSTNWSRHNANRASLECWHAGRAWN